MASPMFSRVKVFPIRLIIFTAADAFESSNHVCKLLPSLLLGSLGSGRQLLNQFESDEKKIANRDGRVLSDAGLVEGLAQESDVIFATKFALGAALEPLLDGRDGPGERPAG